MLSRGEQDRQHDAQLRAIGRKRLFGERQRIGVPPGDVEEISEIAGRGRNVRMIGTERTFADRQRTAIERLRVGVALLMLVETGEIVQRACDVGMVRSQHLFADRERAPDRRLGIRIAVEVAVELAEIVQERRDRRMLGATGLLVDRERALKQRLGFGLTLLLDIVCGEIVEGLTDVGMLARQRLLANGERTLEQRLGLCKAALPLIERGEVVQHRCDLDAVETGPLLHQCNGALVERLGLVVVALVGVDLREVVERAREITIVGGLLERRHHGLRQRQRLRIFAGASERVDPRALRGETLLGKAGRGKRCGDRERQTRNQRQTTAYHEPSRCRLRTITVLGRSDGGQRSNCCALVHLRARFASKADQHLAQRRAVSHPLREVQPQRSLAILHVEAFGVAAGAAPVALRRAEEFCCIEAHGVAVVGIHVRDRPLLRRQQILGAGEVRQELLGLEIDNAAEAGDQMGSRGSNSEEREILKRNKGLGGWMGIEIPPLEEILVGIGLFRPAGQHDSGALQRIAGRAFVQHQGDPVIRQDVPGVHGQARDQQDRRAIGVARQIDQGAIGIAAAGHQRCQRPLARAPEQRFGKLSGVEIGGRVHRLSRVRWLQERSFFG
ncbi:hypothetical protein ACVI8K_003975 [Bradyrhizobium barranii subsp. barranii]